MQIGALGNVISDIVPSKASPVLKGNLTLKVSSFQGTLAKSDLSVRLVSKTDPSNFRDLNIIELSNDSGNKYIKVKYGGAYSGLYNVVVTSKQYGNFDTSSLTFEALGKVTEFSPKSGSLYGGTMITIKGYNFSETDITDNNVRVGYTDCLVESTSNTEIKCRTLSRFEGEEGVDDLIVLLKVSEEAVFELDSKFTWIKTGLPKMTSYETVWDDTSKEYVLKIYGTGFGSSLAGTEVLIDDFEQTVLSVTDSEVQVQIVNMLDSSSKNVKFYLPVGIPEGTEQFITTGINLSPRIVSVTPKIGSLGGTQIQASVKGVGQRTSTLNLITSTGQGLCQTVTIPKYGEVLCRTAPSVNVNNHALRSSWSKTIVS